MIKKIFFAIIFSVFILINSDHVFAKTYYPYASSLNGTQFTNNYNSNNASLHYFTSTSNGQRTLDFTISVAYTNMSSGNPLADSFQNYPYTLIFFKSAAFDIDFSRTATCNQSCFNSQFQIKKLNSTTYNGYTGYYNYVLVLTYSKYYNWTSGSMTASQINDNFRLTVLDDYRLTDWIFTDIMVTDDLSILNNSFDSNEDIIQTLLNSNISTNNMLGTGFTNLGNSLTNLISTTINNNQDLINELKEQMNNDAWQTLTEQKQFWDDAEHVNDGSISDIITMPITLLTVYLDSFDDTCQPFVLGSLFDTEIVFPCINLGSYLGNELWTIIDTLISGFMIYNICMKFVRIFKSLTDLEDSSSFNDMFGGGN